MTAREEILMAIDGDFIAGHYVERVPRGSDRSFISHAVELRRQAPQANVSFDESSYGYADER